MIKEFLKKAFAKEDPSTGKQLRLPGPQEMVDMIGRDLVVVKGREPDWVWNLKCLLQPIPGEQKAYYVRVYSPASAQAQKVQVKNYSSLDGHADLILYSAIYEKKKMFVQVIEGADPPVWGRAA